jgi:DNA polymerase
MVPWSTEWKTEKLMELYESWADCKKCILHEGRTNVVFGVGNINADIMMIGEGPGESEDLSGIPFQGKSGDLLLGTMWPDAGGEPEELFIDNVVSCRPPGNREPYGNEKDCCMERLRQVIYIIDPLLIVTVGKFALTALLGGRSWGIEAEHGKVFSSPSTSYEVTGERKGAAIPGKFFPRKGEDKKEHELTYDVLPIFHPSYISRTDEYNTKTKSFNPRGPGELTIQDLKTARKRIFELRNEYKAIERKL